MLQIGSEPYPYRTVWKINDTLNHIGSVHIGLDVASSPFSGISDFGPLVTISDVGNNHLTELQRGPAKVRQPIGHALGVGGR